MLFTSLLAKDIATFDTAGTGELTSRLSSDVSKYQIVHSRIYILI